MELLLHQWEDLPELYRNTDKTEVTEIVIIDSQINYRGKLDTYVQQSCVDSAVDRRNADETAAMLQLDPSDNLLWRPVVLHDTGLGLDVSVQWRIGSPFVIGSSFQTPL